MSAGGGGTAAGAEPKTSRRNALTPSQLIRMREAKEHVDNDALWQRQNNILGLSTMQASVLDKAMDPTGKEGAAAAWARHLATLKALEPEDTKAEPEEKGVGLRRWNEHVANFKKKTGITNHKEALIRASESYRKSKK